jgi:hypothetical protein
VLNSITALIVRFYLEQLVFCAPFAIMGIISALVFARILESGRQRLAIFLAAYLTSYLALFQAIKVSWGHTFPGAGFLAYGMLPFVPIVFVVALILTCWRQETRLMTLLKSNSWMLVGLIIVFAIQLSAQPVYFVISPWLMNESTMCMWLWEHTLTC